MSEEETGQALGGDDQASAEEAPQLSEVEQLAAERGWKPKTDFKGNEDDWRPASEFIRRIPDQRSLQREMKHLRDTMDKMTSAQSKTMQRSLDEQREKIESRFAEAVDNKDTKGAAAAANEMRKLEAETAATAHDPNTTEKDFASRNPWYGKDAEATDYAVSVSQRLARQGKSVDEQLAGVEESVKKRFPELYGDEKPAPRPQPSVNTPSRGSGNRGPKGYADLPTEAKRAADRFAADVAAKYGKDPEAFKKQYAADFFANTEAA